MSKSATIFSCQTCGHSSQKWLGRCPACGEWNSFVQEVVRPSSGPSQRLTSLPGNDPIALSSIDLSEHPRLPTGIGELDRVLGGGLVPGGLVLVGGDPGIGKSTLLLQVADRLANGRGEVLYASAEESAHQVRLRAERLDLHSDRLLLLPETDIGAILRHVEGNPPACLIVDSIQTVYDPDLDSAPGTVSQVRHCASRIMRLVKDLHVATFLVGHVTKEGLIAGPRVLEHIVDTVLYFEGDSRHIYRIVRSVKNRFGSTDEIGIFEMSDAGLTEVANPSAMLLSERAEHAAGSVVVAVMEGTRPLLLEMQALVAPSYLAAPRRSETGVDHNRAGLIFAVLEKRLGMRLSNQDIFVNVAGGIKVLEPAADLAIAMAVVSSANGLPVDPFTVVIGEIGLSGEVRAVSQVERRLLEARRLGFSRAVAPARSMERMSAVGDMEILPAATVSEAVDHAFALASKGPEKAQRLAR
ncbi:MAG TPA: DNA repair protein RadA [Armatimonadota bacterium]|nr:DNA repair protein RadA [Armatimonadota bacterium]